MRDRHKLATFCMDYYYLCQKLRFYYERSRYIVKGWDFIVNGRDVLWQVKIYYERSRLYYEWSRISCWQIKIPGRDFHNGCLRSSWWQVDIFMTGQDFVVKGQDFHDDRSKCCYENRPFHALVCLNSEALGDDVVTCLWPIHAIGLKVVDVFYQFLAKMGSFAVCHLVVGPYTEKRQPRWMERPKVYFLFGWSTGCVIASWLQEGRV